MAAADTKRLPVLAYACGHKTRDWYSGSVSLAALAFRRHVTETLCRTCLRRGVVVDLPAETAWGEMGGQR